MLRTFEKMLAKIIDEIVVTRSDPQERIITKEEKKILFGPETFKQLNLFNVWGGVTYEIN